MERKFEKDASRMTIQRARGFFILSAMTLAGLIILASLLSLAGSAWARLAWVGGVVLLATIVLLGNGNTAQAISRLKGLLRIVRPLCITAGVALLILFLLNLAATPIARGEQSALLGPTTPTPPPTLSLRASPGTVAPGDRLTWIATAGGSDADLFGDIFALDLSQGSLLSGGHLTVVEAVGPNGACAVNTAGNEITCSVGDSATQPSASDRDIAIIIVEVNPNFHINNPIL